MTALSVTGSDPGTALPPGSEPSAAESVTALLRAEGISKSFGSIRALAKVDLLLKRGTVHAIVGHNGAGKSTLMKVLSGVVAPDSGTIYLNGAPKTFSDPRHAQYSGISMVHQELSVLEDLDVAENIFLGREPTRFAGVTARAELDRMTRSLLDDLHIQLGPRTLCKDLSVGQKQMVEIARAMSWDATVVILDEPTAALGPAEREALFFLIERLKRKGIGFLYISHRLDEILSLADWITVFRDGRDVASLPRERCDHNALVELMLGHGIEKLQVTDHSRAQVTLMVSGLTSASGKLRNVDLSVKAGEIVGLAGMLGSGRSELFECLFGMREFESGEVLLNGTPFRPKSPNDAIGQRVGLVPEDRKLQGIFVGTSLWRNIALPSIQDRFRRCGFVTIGQAKNSAARQSNALNIRSDSGEQAIELLSGGNQQKAILGRWILREPTLLLLDEPTAGIDIESKNEIYKLIRHLAEEGVGVIFSSSEFDELIGLCNRILIIRDGSIIAELPGDTATEHKIVNWTTGGQP